MALRSLSRERLANRVSDLFNPYYSSSPFFLLVALGSSRHAATVLFYWLVLTLFFSALPMWDIRRRIRLGLVGDAHISNREDRIKPFLFALGSAALGLATVYAVNAPDTIRAISWIVVLTGAVITGVTAFWKISLHAAGIASIILVLVMLYGAIAIPTILLLPLVVWARLTLQKHTPAQLAAGILASSAIVLLVFGYFDLL